MTTLDKSSLRHVTGGIVINVGDATGCVTNTLLGAGGGNILGHGFAAVRPLGRWAHAAVVAGFSALGGASVYSDSKSCDAFKKSFSR
jgi:hypothetical protein